LLLCGFAVWLAAPESASLGAVVRETIAALAWQPGPLDFHDELGAVDEAVGLTGVLVLAASLWMVFRPLAPPAAFPDLRLRRAAAGLVRRHGSDTLAYFKLRRDQHYLFSPDRRAFLGYRVEAGVLLVSGDPVGPGEAIPSLLRELSLFAETRGLRIAALGAGESMRPLWEQLGLRSMYLGDEAVVETGSFSLDGRARASGNTTWPASCWNRFAWDASSPRCRSCTCACVQASVDARTCAFVSRCLSSNSSARPRLVATQVQYEMRAVPLGGTRMR